MKRLEPDIPETGEEYKVIQYAGDILTCICGYELLK